MAELTRRRLPIGMQTFGELRERNCYYVDKTDYVWRLTEEGKHYFLSRPRRFGKSLLVDTLKELFEGNEPLFAGLDIHGRWNWSVRHPVVRLDFGSGSFRDAGYLHTNAMAQLEAVAEEAGVAARYDTAPERFRDLLRRLHRQAGRRAVVLVDEYDKPILDALETPEIARANRDYLRGLYGTIKSADADIHFSFLTGVSKFTKVSVFSELNNLIDITLEPGHSGICGYTDRDLDTVFAAELAGLDRDEIRHWYNGYGWLGAEKVYNPFDILLLFRRRRFGAWWFETATPSFLIETLARRGVRSVDLDGMLSSGDLLSEFDADRIAPEALLFQTGYLTIRRTERRGSDTYYRLGYPNHEVRQSLNTSLLNHLLGYSHRVAEHRTRLYDVLKANDFAGLEALLQSVYAGIPYEWHTNNDIAAYEGYYASVFYSYFTGSGFDVRVEDSSSRGRLDMAVPFNDAVYLFEFKVVELAAAGAAMAQLREKRYADKYRGLGGPIYLVAAEFSKVARNLHAFAVERA